MIVILRAAFLLVFLAAVAACGGSDSGDDGQSSPAGTVTAETAVDAVQSFDPEENDAVARLNEVAYAGGDFVPDLAPLLEDEDAEPNQRWAALYLIALATDTDEEIAVLKPVLDDPEPIFQAMAAGSLAGLGVTDALPVLIEALSSDADLPFSEPPRPLSAYARLTLEHYTGESFDDAGGWEDWWDDAESGIRWEGGEYVTD